MSERPTRPVLIWLAVLLAMVAAMVMLGGVTRLTGSGLSMVEWRPLMGALPPMGDAEWQAVFEKYQRFPQYQQVNQWMALEDFKRIFFWEYLHRLVGRLVGVVFFLPWIFFVVRGRLRGRWMWRTLVAGVLGGLQGLLGWFMVRSGLVDLPAVSHLRLAAHLSLAFVVACWIAWLLYEALPADEAPPRPALARAAWALVAVVALQTVYGAFMAGTRAGFLFATFPDMHGEMVPTLGHLTNDPTTIHFIHRALGWVALLAGCAWWWRGRAVATSIRQRRAVHLVLVAVGFQFLLGVATVVMRVPTTIATAHQLGALLLICVLLFAVFAFTSRASGPRVADEPSGD